MALWGIYVDLIVPWKTGRQGGIRYFSGPCLKYATPYIIIQRLEGQAAAGVVKPFPRSPS